VQTLRAAAAIVALGRTRRSLRPFPAAIESQLLGWQQAKRRGRRPRLAISTSVRSASVLGCGSPVIAVHPVLLDALGTDDLDRVVIHEWAHVQRRDDLVHAAQLAVRVVAGWHPAVWWLSRQLSIERELACDDMAVTLTGNAKTYARCLAMVAALLPRRLHGGAAVGVLSAPALSDRIVRILRHGNQMTPAGSATASTAAVLAILTVSIAAAGVEPIAVSGAASPAPVATTLSTEVARSPGSQPAGDGAVGARTSNAQRPPATTGPAPAEPEAPRAGRLPLVNTTEAPAVAVEADTKASVGGVAVDPLPSQFRPTPFAGIVPVARRDAELPVTVAAAPAGEQPTSPWAAAANTGVAVGRGSQRAGTATASLFTRLGKRIASSF
jgi:hypothetical protein